MDESALPDLETVPPLEPEMADSVEPPPVEEIVERTDQRGQPQVAPKRRAAPKKRAKSTPEPLEAESPLEAEPPPEAEPPKAPVFEAPKPKRAAPKKRSTPKEPPEPPARWVEAPRIASNFDLIPQIDAALHDYILHQERLERQKREEVVRSFRPFN